MQTKALLFILFILMSGCTSPEPKNRWQYDAVASLNEYQTHFLQNHLLRAASDLSEARGFASQSSDLHTRISIELSACAMQIAVLKPASCEHIEKLLLIEPNPVQLAYLHLLQMKHTSDELTLLPIQYRSFARYMLEQDTKKVNRALSSIQPISSRLIASALAKDLIDEENIKTLIAGLSYNGYKHPLLGWLKIQMQKEDDPIVRNRLKAKIDILTSD